MKNFSLNSLSDRLTKDSFDGNINEAFELYILMQQLAENYDVAKSNLERKKFTAE